jgi:hypothetical protein
MELVFWLMDLGIEIKILHKSMLFRMFSIFKIELKCLVQNKENKRIDIKSYTLIQLEYVDFGKLKILWGKLFDRKFEVFRKKIEEQDE